MATSIPSIIDSYPADGAQGIPVGDQITVTFDQEMDESSINTGTFILVGPDTAPVFGPIDVTPFDQPGFDDEDILSSPYFAGYVKGTISFSRVNASGGWVSDDEEDTTGDGTLWNTVALFTPDKPLKPNVQYTVHILGDESSSETHVVGVRTRTVFDTVFTGSGTGRLTFDGGYTGTTQRTYWIEISAGGATGTAEYIWWEETEPLVTYSGITSTGERELEDGIYITCNPDGTFTAGDRFSVVIFPAYILPNNYRWTFYTGSGSVLTPPSSSSASGIGSITTNVVGLSNPTFYVSDTNPSYAKYGVPISEDPYTGETITITFSTTPDGDTLTDDTINLYSESANGDSAYTATGDLDYTASLDGNILTIDLDPLQLYTNNIVILELDKTITDTSGNYLNNGKDYNYYFSTTYTPLYSSIRRVMLDLGNLIADLEEETIMFAIWEASIQADIMNFASGATTFFQHARKEYVTCLAEHTLVRGLYGDKTLSDRMTKSLGDLSVSRGGMSGALRNLLGNLQECYMAWETSVQSGGNVAPGAMLKPLISVKGSMSEDAIEVRRQWEPTSGVGLSSYQSAGNAATRWTSRKWLKTFSTTQRSGWYNGSDDE